MSLDEFTQLFEDAGLLNESLTLRGVREAFLLASVEAGARAGADDLAALDADASQAGLDSFVEVRTKEGGGKKGGAVRPSEGLSSSSRGERGSSGPPRSPLSNGPSFDALCRCADLRYGGELLSGGDDEPLDAQVARFLSALREFEARNAAALADPRAPRFAPLARLPRRSIELDLYEPTLAFEGAATGTGSNSGTARRVSMMMPAPASVPGLLGGGSEGGSGSRRRVSIMAPGQDAYAVPGPGPGPRPSFGPLAPRRQSEASGPRASERGEEIAAAAARARMRELKRRAALEADGGRPESGTPSSSASSPSPAPPAEGGGPGPCTPPRRLLAAPFTRSRELSLSPGLAALLSARGPAAPPRAPRPRVAPAL
eukprot:tig00020710_g13252.t1